MTPAKPESKNHRRFRFAGRWMMLVMAVCLAWPLRSESWTSVLLPALSPFVSVGAALATRSVGMVALLALPVLVIAWFIPRAFCRYGCPVGLLQETLEQLRPTTRLPWLRLPSLGPWLVLLTLAGACLGYPLFLWLDPLALFNGGLNAWRQPFVWASLAAGLGLPALLLFDLALPKLWCQRICPLGASQELLTQSHGCLTRLSTRCGENNESSTPARFFSGRRAFIAACAGAVGAFTLKTARGQPPPLRPPGAIDEQRFSGVCVRCGNCAQVCPSQIIQPDLGGRVASLLTPLLNFDRDYCRENCHRCHEVCPNGAIARLALSEKRRAVIGPAQVDLDTCLLALGRECNACIQRCPYEAIIIQSTDDGFSTFPRVDLKKCTGCGACEATCPVRPTRAIQIIPGPGWL